MPSTWKKWPRAVMPDTIRHKRLACAGLTAFGETEIEARIAMAPSTTVGTFARRLPVFVLVLAAYGGTRADELTWPVAVDHKMHAALGGNAP
jgi:hypothetical protein